MEMLIWTYYGLLFGLSTLKILDFLNVKMEFTGKWMIIYISISSIPCYFAYLLTDNDYKACL